MPTIADAGVILAALLVVILPGGLLAFSLRLAGLWWFAAAGVFSIGLVGVGGVLASVLSVPFGPFVVAVLAAVSAFAMGAVAFARGGPGLLLRPVLGEWSRAVIAPVIGMLVSSIAIVVIAFGHVESFSAIGQTYDAVFHLNAAASIVQNADASSFNLYNITHDDPGIDFYPAAWHSLVALTVWISGASVPAATNAVWIATSTVVWIPGVVLLASSVTTDRRRGIVVATSAALFASCFAAFPSLLLNWGILYPTGLAYTLLGFGLAIAVAVVTNQYRDDQPSRAYYFAITVAGLIWLAAEGLSHPRSLFSILVLLVPLLALALAQRLRALWGRPELRRRLVVWSSLVLAALVLAGVAAWLFVFTHYQVSTRPVSDRLNGGPATATHTVPEAFLQVIAQSPITIPGNTALAPAIPLAILVIVGAVLAFRSAKTAWLPLSFLMIALLYTLAAGSNDDIAKLATGLWYKDKFRLMAVVAVIGVPLASLAIGALYGRARRLAGRHAALIALVVAIAVAASSWFGPTLRGMSEDIGTVFSVGERKDGRLVDNDQLALFDRLAELTPDDAIIVGNPWNGSSLTWALADRQPLFPHLTGVWSPDATIIAQRLDRALLDPDVCEAVARLGLEYVVDDPDLLWGDPPEADFYAGISRAPSSGVLEPVESRGSTTLYRITACD